MLADLGKIIEQIIAEKLEQLTFPAFCEVAKVEDNKVTLKSDKYPNLLSVPVANLLNVETEVVEGDTVLFVPSSLFDLSNGTALLLTHKEQNLSDYAALASKVEQHLNNIKTVFNLHVHDGPPSTTQITDTFDVKSAKVKIQ